MNSFNVCWRGDTVVALLSERILLNECFETVILVRTFLQKACWVL